VHKFFIVKNIYVSNDDIVSMNFDFLTHMSFFLKDIIFTVNSLRGLQRLDLFHCNYEIIPNFLMSKTYFMKKLKIVFKWFKMLNEKKDFSSEQNEKLV